MPPGGGSLGPRGHLTEEEKANNPQVSRALLLRIGGYLKPYWLQFIFVFIAVVLYLMAIFDMDEPVALIALVTAIATSEQVVSAQIKCKKIQAAVDINAPDSNEDDCGGADDGEEVELMMVVPRKKKKKGR